jgi:hypothetical protein
MIRVSSIFETIVTRPSGGLVAAVRIPWYLRVFAPETVPDAKPPMPFVSSHSRDEAASKSVQTFLSNLIILLLMLFLASFSFADPKSSGLNRFGREKFVI